MVAPTPLASVSRDALTQLVTTPETVKAEVVAFDKGVSLFE